ncbi:MAG TPA: DUF4012 domain-containing protein [Ktedonobacterales bacterium]
MPPYAASGESVGPMLPPLAGAEASQPQPSGLGQSASKWITGAADDVRWLANRSASGISGVSNRVKEIDLRELGDRILPPATRSRLAGSAGRWQRGLRARIATRRSGWLVTATVVIVLLVTVLPPLIGVAHALQDYQRLKTLGESGIQHLLAAKDDIGDVSALQQYTSFLTPADDVVNAPYTYEAQRQSGTFYNLKVNVQPSSSLANKGLTPATFTTQVGTNTTFPYGAPAATPTPSPAPTPSATATPSPGSKGTPTPAPKPVSADSLKAAEADLRAAQSDFAQLRNLLNNPDWVLGLAGTIPGTNARLVTVRALADVGYNGASILLEFADAVSPITKRLQGGLLSASGPILLPADITALHKAIKDALSKIDLIQARLSDVDLSGLPITADQAATFMTLTKAIPKARETLAGAGDYLDMAAWFLGVGTPRNFLLQTLDRAELRPTGGFTGNYGIVTVNGGHLEPFSLYNVNDIDYGYKTNSWIFGRTAPSPYTWWPFGNWGLRDSNLSGDFPTTAKINIDVFANEGGGAVDGVIHLGPVVIEHALQITGPIFVPNYNETVTAANFEDRIHYYQQDPAGIAKEQQLNPDDNTHSLRKRFTQLVVQLVQDKVKTLPQAKLVEVVKMLVTDLRSKDIQLYVTNQKVEDLLLKYRLGGAVDTRPGIDGYFMDQANTSVAKSTPYVQMTQTDNVTLDDQGGATHRLTITMFNNQTGPVYGYSTYHDFMRIYVPPQASLKRGTGFDSANPLCWVAPPWDPSATKPAKYADVPDCDPNPYPDGELKCPTGGYGPGDSSVGGYGVPQALDTLGPPTATTSDLPGRGMFGGWVTIPNGCTATLTLRWYVPNIVHP